MHIPESRRFFLLYWPWSFVILFVYLTFLTDSETNLNETIDRLIRSIGPVKLIE